MVGGPAHAREMVETGAGLVCASHSELLAEGDLPLDEWVELVRAKQPPAARFRCPSTWWARVRGAFRRRTRRARRR